MLSLQNLTGRLLQLAAVLLVALSLPAMAQTAAPQEGREYVRLKNAISAMIEPNHAPVFRWPSRATD